MASEDAWRDSYDSWKTDAPDPGSSTSGDTFVMKLNCQQCAWHVADANAGNAFLSAIGHVEETGHLMLYRGKVQDLSRWVKARRHTVAKIEAASEQPVLKGRAR